MAVDRVLAIILPFWHRNHSSPAIARGVSITISLYCYLLATPVLYMFALDPEKDRCLVRDTPYDRVLSMFSWTYNYVFFFGVPFAILGCSNVVFIYSLKKRSSGVRKTASGAQGVSEQARKKAQNERNYVVMLLILTSTYTVLSMSVAIINYVSITQLEDIPPDASIFFKGLTQIPPNVNSSLNFLFYYFSGPMFRVAFKKAFRRLLGVQNESEAQIATSTAAATSVRERQG